MFLAVTVSCIPGCGQTFIIKDDESTQIMRVGKDIKNWPVFIPGEDKSWVPAMSDISKGDVIYTNPENLKDILDSAKTK